MKVFVVVLFFLGYFFGNLRSQTIYKIGYSFGANNTVSLTEKSDNRTKGFNHLFVPNTWSNHWYVGIQQKKNEFFIAMDGGGLGVQWRVKTYPNKYPYTGKWDETCKCILNVEKGVKGSSRINTNLLKFSILYKNTFIQNNKFSHKLISGLGLLKTRKQTSGLGGSFGSFYHNDSLGWVNHGVIGDKYQYYRLTNFYLIGGYEFSYKLNVHWNINAQIIYNQGLFRMIRFHTYRTYTESLTGYSEFDEQWSFTRLSYAAFLTGVSYNFTFKKKKKEVNIE